MKILMVEVPEDTEVSAIAPGTQVAVDLGGGATVAGTVYGTCRFAEGGVADHQHSVTVPPGSEVTVATSPPIPPS